MKIPELVATLILGTLLLGPIGYLMYLVLFSGMIESYP